MKSWQDLHPSRPLKQLVPLLLLGWLIVNSSSLCFFLGMPIFGMRPTLADRILTSFTVLSGWPWLQNWVQHWIWLIFILPIFVFFWLVWLKKPSILTAGFLAVSGMATGPANLFLLGGLLPFSLVFAIMFLFFIWIVQKVWDNWDAPAPLPEEAQTDKDLPPDN